MSIAAIAVLMFSYTAIKKEKEKTCCLDIRRLSYGKHQHRSLSDDECAPCPDTNVDEPNVENGAVSDDVTAGVDATGKRTVATLGATAGAEKNATKNKN